MLRHLSKAAATQASSHQVVPPNLVGSKLEPKSISGTKTTSKTREIPQYSRFYPRDNQFINRETRLDIGQTTTNISNLTDTFLAANQKVIDQGGSQSIPFVSVEWLKKRLSKPETADNIQIFDCSWRLTNPDTTPREEYLMKHIPNARFFDIDYIAGDNVEKLPTDKPHRVPSDEVFNAKATIIGFSPHRQTILYDSTGMLGAARVLWNLQLMGFSDTRVLQGGLAAWEKDGNATESGENKNVMSSPQAFSGDRKTLATLNDVVDNLYTKEHIVVDARSPGRFNGTEPEPRAGYKSGHIPFSLNVPYGDLITTCPKTGGNVLRPFPELMDILEKAGVPLQNPDQKMIATCGSGMTASTLYLALKACGFRNVKLYDGSWMEWASPSHNRPIVKTGQSFLLPFKHEVDKTN